MNSRFYTCLVCLVVLFVQAPVVAQDKNAGSQAQELAKKVANPVASLISFPIKATFDTNIGPTDGGSRLAIKVQPVVPIELSKSWNMISRTIMPIVSQSEVFPGSGNQFGLGDIQQSLFFSPRVPTKGGLIWGAGPILLLPTATDSLLGGGKWGAGPTLVVLTQKGPKTVGVLTNHIWSVAGSDSRADVSSTFIQPFLSFTTPGATTYGLNAEATYDWKAEEWSVPVNLTIAQLTRFGKRPVSVSGGLRYWLRSPDSGPEGFGLTFQVTYLFPR